MKSGQIILPILSIVFFAIYTLACLVQINNIILLVFLISSFVTSLIGLIKYNKNKFCYMVSTVVLLFDTVILTVMILMIVSVAFSSFAS